MYDVWRRTLKQQGCHSFEVVDQVSPVSSSAAIGDVADEVDATLLVMSTEVRLPYLCGCTGHQGHVWQNLT